MPIYDAKCACGHEARDVYAKMNSLIPCPKCGGTMERVPSLPHTDLKEFHTPIEMYSVAVEELVDVRRLKAACPDADISDDPASELYGVPVARSRKAKMQVLKATGFMESNSERVR